MLIRLPAFPHNFFSFHSGKPDDRSSILSSSKKPLQTDKYNLKYNQNRNRFEQELLGKSGAAAKASKSFNLLDVMGSMKKDKKSSYEDIRAKELEQKLKRDRETKERVERQIKWMLELQVKDKGSFKQFAAFTKFTERKEGILHEYIKCHVCDHVMPGYEQVPITSLTDF